MRYVVLIVLCCLASGCATEPLKAPCDYQGIHCWPRTLINQWDN